MGDVQSAQREDAAAAAAQEEEEEVQVEEQEEVQVEQQQQEEVEVVLIGGIGKVDDVQSEPRTEDKPLTNGGQVVEMNGMADSGVGAFNGHCKDQSPGEDQDVKGRRMSRDKEEQTSLQKVKICSKKRRPDETDSAEEEPGDVIEMETKQNDINETFRKFFSNIGLKLTVKRGSTDKVEPATRVPEEEPRGEPGEEPEEEPGEEPEELEGEPEEEPQEQPEEELKRPDYINNVAEEVQTESSDQRMDGNSPQEVCDNDSTTCPTMTDGTSEDFADNAEEKTTGTKDEVECEHADLDATNEEEQGAASAPVDEVVASPLKKFFTTGIFSGLQKKKRSIQDEVIERELVDRGLKQTAEKKEKPSQDQEKLIIPGVETSPTEKEALENEPEEILSSPSPSTDPSIIVVTGTEILSSQEKVPASPLRRFLSGSSLRRLSKKPGSRRSSDGKLSDSGEYVSDHLVSSTESADRRKEESPPRESPGGPVVEQGQEEDEEGSAWASFKKLMTPKKRIKRPSAGGDEAPTSGAITEGKPGEGGQISKDGKMSESGELVSQRVPSATEEESTPQTSPEEEGAWASFIKLMTPKKRLKELNEEAQNPEIMVEMKPRSGEKISDQSTEEGKKRKDSSVSWEAVLCGSGRKRSRKTSDSESETPQMDEQKRGTDSPLESSNEAHKTGTSSPEKAESSAESDEGSTWKLFKKLVTPKKKAKEVHESKDGKQSDSESLQDDSFFSVKKLVSVRKKTKSEEKSDHASSDEADKDATSYDEDSETPAVVPLSEFDTDETVVHIQTQADIESYTRKEAELQKDLLDETPKTAEENDEKAAGNKVPRAALQDAEAGDSSDLVSKHQQLSDIPEEGVITETAATLPSVTEEVARDDTMAEDLIEITSEALTAPEPTDVTTADETEMVSAVSRLSESSKTSGDTTPVPDESSDRDTEALLQQAAETIDSTLTASSEETSSDGIVHTVWSQILKTFGKEKSKDDADLDVVEEDAAQTESVSNVNDALSTEIRPEEFGAAAGTVDDAVGVSQLQEDSKESEITAGSQTQSVDMEKAQQIVAENNTRIVSNDLREQDPVGAQQSDGHALGKEETVAEIPLKESLQNKPSEHEDVEAPETEPEAAALDKEAENSHALQKDAEPEEETSPCTEGTVGAVGAPEVVEATSDYKPSGLEKEETSGAESEPKTKYQKMIQFILDVPAVVKKVKDEPKNEAASPTEPAVDPDVSEAASAVTEADRSQNIETETVLEDVKASERVQDETALPVGEDLEEEPAVLLDTEADVSQMVTNETKSEDVQTARAIPDETGEKNSQFIAAEPNDAQIIQKEETATDNSAAEGEKDETESVLKSPRLQRMFQFIKKVLDEPKNEETSPTETEVTPVGTSDTERVPEPEEVEAAGAVTSDTEAKNSHVIQTEVNPSEAVKDETTPPFVEPVEASDVLDAAPTKILDPEAKNSQLIAAKPNDAQIIQKEETAAVISAAEGEKDETESVLKSPRLQRMFQFIKKVLDEPKQEETFGVASEDAPEIERVEEPEELEAAAAVTLDKEAEDSHILETEGKSETTGVSEAVRDETVPSIVEPVEASDVLDAAPAILLGTEAKISQLFAKETISEEIEAAEMLEDETKLSVKDLNGAPQLLEAASALDSEPSGAQIIQKEETAADISAAEPEKDKTESVLKSPRLQRMFQFIKKVLDEPKQEPTSPAETDVAREDALEPDEAEAAAAMTSNTGSDNSKITEEPEETSEEIPETKRKEPEEETEVETNYPKVIQFVLDVPAVVKKVMDEPQKEATDTADAPKTEHVEEAGRPQELQTEATSENLQEKVTEETTVLTEGLDETVSVHEVSPSETSKTEKEILQVAEKETVSEDTEARETVTEKPVTISEETVEVSATLDSEPSDLKLPDKEKTPEVTSAAETDDNEPKEEAETEAKSPTLQKMFQFILDVPAAVKRIIKEPETEARSSPETDEASVEASKDDDAQETLESEAGIDETSSPKLEKENTGDIQAGDETTSPDDGIGEPVGVPEVEETEPDATLDSEPIVPQILEKEDVPEEASPAETEQMEVKTEGVQSCKVVEALSPQLVEEDEEVKSEEASPPETTEEDKKEETEPQIEVDDNRSDGAVKLVQERQTAEAEGPTSLREQPEDVETVEMGEVEPTKEAEDSVKVSEIEELQETKVPQAEATLASEEQISKVVSATKVKEVTQVVTLDSETVRPPLLEMQEISEDGAPTETVTEAGGGETTPSPGDVEPEETSEVKHVPEPEAAEASKLDSEARSAQTLEREVVREEIKEALEVDGEPGKTEASPAATQTEDAAVVTSDVQEEQTEKREDASGLDDFSETNQDQKTESAAPDVQFEHEEGATEGEDAPETSGTLEEDKTSSAPVLEEPATVEQTSTLSTESAKVSNEPTREEIKTGTVQEVEDIACRLDKVSARESSEEHELLIASETELNETIETTTPAGGADETERAETACEVVVIHAPTVEPNDNHRIQVQVVHVDVGSADGTVETTLDVIDVCHKAIEGLDTLSTTPETEGGATDEEKLVTVEEVVQLLKNPPEAGPEREEVGVEQQETVTEVSETNEGESKEAEDEEEVKESSDKPEEEPESSAVPIEPVSGEHGLGPESLGGLEVSVESKKTEADMETSEGGVCSEEFITEVQAGSEVLEDAGIISSDVDETSAETSSAPHSDETLHSTQQAKSSDADIQAESENATQEAEGDNHESEKSVQAAENLEPAERVATTNQPVTQSEETTEPEEQITSPGDVQAAETMEPTRQTEEDEVQSPTGAEEVQSPTGAEEVQSPTGPEEVQSPTGPDELCDDESNKEKPSEEETDQDVWLDAEEDIYSQKELEASKSESDTEDGDGRPATEGGGGGGRGEETESESEGEAEDFAIALEDLELTSIVPKEED